MTTGLEVVETFVQSRHGVDGVSEDMIRDGEHWLVLVDGATDKSGIDFDGQSGGFRVAQVVCDVVATATAGTTAGGLVELINARYWDVLGTALKGVESVDYPSASFVAVNKTASYVIRVGDTSWRSEVRACRGGKKIDQITRDARAVLLRCLLAEGAQVDELRRDDPGREMILPILRHQATFRNVDDVTNPLTFGSIDGGTVPDHFIETWKLDPEETTIVLTSDGYPRPELTLKESEAALAGVLAADPLQAFDHPGTKAVPDAVGASYDDRAYARLVRA